MFTFRRPSDEQIRAYLTRQADEPFSYSSVGCTREGPPAKRGWNIDRQRVLLGQGPAAFKAGVAAIQSWQMFPPEIARVCWPDQPPRMGLLVAVLYKVKLLPMWILFPARVVWLVDDQSDVGAGRVHRFGFAYGTLRDHPERGEERFVVEWNQTDDTVWYDLLAVSRPAHWLAWRGYPFTRWEQTRFRRMSGAAMQRAVAKSYSSDAACAASRESTPRKRP